MKIDTFEINEESNVFIIAELSANHNGDLNTAIETIRAAKRSGADCIKLQTYTAETITLDCDKEGENICFEVLEICKKNIPRSSHRVQRVYRAKFSSIANKDIVAAFEGLKHEPNYYEAISVDARQVLDLKIGVAFSRFQTTRLAATIRKAGIRMLTYGPC